MAKIKNVKDYTTPEFYEFLKKRRLLRKFNANALKYWNNEPLIFSSLYHSFEWEYTLEGYSFWQYHCEKENF